MGREAFPWLGPQVPVKRMRPGAWEGQTGKVRTGDVTNSKAEVCPCVSGVAQGLTTNTPLTLLLPAPNWPPGWVFAEQWPAKAGPSHDSIKGPFIFLFPWGKRS